MGAFFLRLGVDGGVDGDGDLHVANAPGVNDDTLGLVVFAGERFASTFVHERGLIPLDLVQRFFGGDKDLFHGALRVADSEGTGEIGPAPVGVLRVADAHDGGAAGERKRDQRAEREDREKLFHVCLSKRRKVNEV